MEMPKDYDETVGITGDYEALEPGGYICKIVSAKEEKSKARNPMLVLAIDIADGDFKGFFQRRFDEMKKQNTDPSKKVKWSNNAIHRIMVYDKDGKTNKFFKGFGTIIEESNKNYKWTGDESTLKNKLIGAIFGEEEYEKMDGSIGISTKIKNIRTIQAIKENKFKVPELKRLPQENETYDFGAIDDDDLPF